MIHYRPLPWGYLPLVLLGRERWPAVDHRPWNRFRVHRVGGRFAPPRCFGAFFYLESLPDQREGLPPLPLESTPPQGGSPLENPPQHVRPRHNSLRSNKWRDRKQFSEINGGQ